MAGLMMEVNHVPRQLCVAPCVPMSTSETRHWCLRVMERWAVPDAVRADVEVSVSELVTNVVCHGSCRVVTCALTLSTQWVLVEVQGRDLVAVPATVPTLSWPSSSVERGRGLQLVGALSTAWGSTRPSVSSSDGFGVWARFGTAL
jgi:hypothetical protein